MLDESRTAAARQSMPAPKAAQMIADCDIHPMPNSVNELHPYLEQRWIDYLRDFDMVRHFALVGGSFYPKAHAQGLRQDAYPSNGRLPGSDLPFMAKQHLDPNNVALGMLLPICVEQSSRNVPFAAAYCRAINDWQKENWTTKDKRLRASILVPYEDPTAAVAEIERRANDPDFAQVMLPSRTGTPFGDRKFWPIYEATVRAGKVLGFHPNPGDSNIATTTGGWPSYYLEDMAHYSQAYQMHLVSMVSQGVFEAYPGLRCVFIEGGFSWAPPLLWRLDRIWKQLRAEVPEVRRLPSEYAREHVWFSSQPVEEPANPRHLQENIEMIGWDRFMFSSDYPHWDTDAPMYVLPFRASEDQKRAFFYENAARLYGVLA